MRKGLLLAAACALSVLAPGMVFGHCDTLDGPAVQAARRALESGNVDEALIWVREKDEPEVREAFQKASIVRKGNAQAKELADRYFYETVVRLHRAGEGAPYTGLKPAGTPVDPAVRAADAALEKGSANDLAKSTGQRVESGIKDRFNDVMQKKQHAKESVVKGRVYVASYVEYVHYVEGISQAAEKPAGHEEGGPAAEEQRHAH